MYSKKNNRRLGVVILFFVFLVSGLILSATAQAIPGGGGNWTALAPYNTLWPLWSPALSPINPTTGLPTPIVSNLAPSTVLPVQPGLTWDPSLLYPWLLYNTPVGMAYYDPLYGVNLWPAPSLSLGPLSLPANYANLPPTSSLWISSYVPIANALYLKSLPKLSTPVPASFVPPVPVAPTAFIPPVPTAFIPPVPLAPTAFFAPVPTVFIPPVPTAFIPPVPTAFFAPIAPVPVTAAPATTIPLLAPSAII